MSHTDHPCCADADVFRRGAEHGEIEILPNPAQPASTAAYFSLASYMVTTTLSTC